MHYEGKNYLPKKVFLLRFNSHSVTVFSDTINRVATNLKNSGNLKNCQNLREHSGKFQIL